MNMTIDEMLAANQQFFSLPEIYVQVRAVVENENSTQQDLADVLSNDPALTARLLRVANSSYFGFPAKIDTLSSAVNLIGFKFIQELVFATSITRTFAGIKPSTIDMAVFWRNSVLRASACRIMAKRCAPRSAESLFVTGLMMDIGHLLMFDQEPQRSEQAKIAALQQQRPLELVEQEIFGFDYAEVGWSLLHQWQLPDSITLVIRHQNTPQKTDFSPLETALAYLAGHVASIGEKHNSHAEITHHALLTIGLNQEELIQVESEALLSISEIMALIMPKKAA